MTHFRVAATAIALFTATAGGVFAADNKVKTVDVQVELSAITNTEAATRFATIEADLENALTARLVDRIAAEGEDGVDITVDLSEVELGNGYTEALGLADTTLVGVVHITDETDNSKFNTYELTVDVNTARTFIPEGTDVTVLPASSDVFYKALIDAYADVVVAKLDE